MKTTTHVHNVLDAHIAECICQLASSHAVVRERARETLVDIGHPAVFELIATFATSHGYQRWEACKALTEIADPASIAVLVRALESEHRDIRWVAAEGLINIGKSVVEPLLIALIHRACAHTILEGAHHVLHAFAQRTSRPIFEPVLAAIHGPHPGVSVPPAVENALLTWRELSTAEGEPCVLRARRRHASGGPAAPHEVRA